MKPAEVLPSRCGLPTLRLGDRFLYSAYDPAREADRAVESAGRAPRLVVGLGLGYLAEAAARRGEAEILASPGETTFLREHRPGLEVRDVVECDADSAARRAARRALDGWTVLFDPSVELRPEFASRTRAAVEAAADPRPLVLLVLLHTAGDVLRATPVAAEIRKSGAEIAFVTREAYRPLLEGNPAIARPIGLPRSCEEELARGDSGAAVEFLSCALPKRPLLGVNLQEDAVAAEVLEAARPRLRSGFLRGGFGDDRGPGRVDEVLAARWRMNRLHFNFLAAGLVPHDDRPSVAVTDEARAASRALLASAGVEGDYVVIQPGAGTEAKTWERKRIEPEILARFAATIDRPRIIIGGSEERERCALAARLSGGIDFSGRTDWPTLAALLEGASFYVGHDSGPTHIAAALGVPTLAIFGFTSPILNGPVGPRVLSIQADLVCALEGCRRPCPERACTAGLTPEALLEARSLMGALWGDPDPRLREALEQASGLRAKGLRVFFGRTDRLDPFAFLLEEQSGGGRRGAGLDPAVRYLWESIHRRERGETGFRDEA